MSTKDIRLKDLNENILHPETDDSLVLNKKLKEETISTGNAFELSDNNGNVIFKVDGEGNIASKNFDSTNCGNVDDVKVNGASVVTNKVANISQAVSPSDAIIENALEFADEQNNIVMQVDSLGNLKTKNFDSTDCGKIDDIKINGQSIVINKEVELAEVAQSGDYEDLDNKPVENETVQGNALEFSDESANVVMQVTATGDLQTKNFDSSTLDARFDAKQDNLPTTTTAGKILTSTSTAGTVEWSDAPETGVTSFAGETGAITINSGHLGMDGKELKVTNIAVEPSSVVIDNALEFSDELGNIVFQVKSTGAIQSKLFDSDETSKINETGSALGLDDTTYILSLKDKNNNVLSTVDLPLESMVIGGRYDNVNKKIILTLKNGQEIEIPVGDLISGLVPSTSVANKVYGTDGSGNQTTFDKDSFGQVDDVKVNGTSVVTNKVANISQAVSPSGAAITNALEFSDENNNVVMQVDANGDIQTKTFDSTNVNNDIASLNAAKHTHSNKSLLDTYTQTEADLADVVIKKHEHSNKNVLDTIATQTAYSAKGTSTKVPQITTNTVGQVTGITEVDINFPATGVTSFATETGDITINSAHLAMTGKQLGVTNIAVEPSTATISNALEFADENNNVAMQVDTAGNIQTKNFDSSELGSLAKKDSLIASDIPDLDASKINSGTFADTRIASAANWNAKSTVSVNSTGTATDEVQYITIDGVEKKLAGGGGAGTVTSVGTGTGLTGGPITTSGTIAVDTTVIAQQSDLAINKYNSSIDNALEFSDSNGHVALQVDANGNIQTKNFDSSEKEIFIATYNTTSYADTLTAYNAGKTIKMVASGSSFEINDIASMSCALTAYTNSIFYFALNSWTSDKSGNPDEPGIMLVTLSSSGWAMGTGWVLQEQLTATGAANNPVYFSTDGTVSACTYELNKTVPSDAVFTDTHYSNKFDIYAGSNLAVSFAQSADKTLTFSGSGATSVTKTSAGNIQISSTDTTYESKAAASSGTDVSLVTTGEKYTWNNKQDIVSGSNGIDISSNTIGLKNNLSNNVNITISTSDPSGGSDGDIWFKY